ncbi:ribonuclease II, chloroplastic/mitochondrial [Senna tora]|uniref:Ribonuclease II, chloroplastic/mitochondrial n=1 Tax=Senna tora TaxID=362788 RepID=A0A834TPV6_9FABA|nr:ribonuclease II, chloroplastic/mitochondrial [Senna tora]
MALMSGEEVPKEKWPLIEKGLLLEFKQKVSYSHIKMLVVADTPHGNNTWIVSHQNLALLELAWMQLIQENKPLTNEELAEDILKAMDMKKSPYLAVNILKDIGYLPLHFNAHLKLSPKFENSMIKLTRAMTYDKASKLLQSNHHHHHNNDDKLRVLSEAASLRLKWRLQQGASDVTTIEARVRVAMASPEDAEPVIKVYLDEQASPGPRIIKASVRGESVPLGAEELEEIVALEASVRVCSGFQKGNEIEEVNPRDNFLLLKTIKKL